MLDNVLDKPPHGYTQINRHAVSYVVENGAYRLSACMGSGKYSPIKL